MQKSYTLDNHGNKVYVPKRFLKQFDPDNKRLLQELAEESYSPQSSRINRIKLYAKILNLDILPLHHHDDHDPFA